MRPSAPQRRIVLINRHGSALYSGMVPALIAGIDNRDAAAIDLRQLCDRAGVAFVQAEIGGIDLHNRQLQLVDRPALAYGLLSLDVGAISRISDAGGIAIKPLEPALAFLEDQDPDSAVPFRVVGAVPPASRWCWPWAPLARTPPGAAKSPPATGGLGAPQPGGSPSRADPNRPRRSSWAAVALHRKPGPGLVENQRLPVDGDGRVRTDPCLEVIGHKNLFAAGDCAVLATAPRPASGVWAVRAAQRWLTTSRPVVPNNPCGPGTPNPQRCNSSATNRDKPGPGGEIGNWADALLWRWKRHIDQRFMAGFQGTQPMASSGPMACRGCAAKLPAQPLQAALQQVGLAVHGRCR